MHPRNCQCGWGKGMGVGNAHSYLPAHEAALLDHAKTFYRANTVSATIPNYSCSCGKRVFFFQSSNGGKVLFESLGPPWPKHDCFGLSYERKKAQIKINKNWLNVSNLSATPSSNSLCSIYSGLVSYPNGSDPITISIELMIDEFLLVKEIYVDKFNNLSVSKEAEVLILFDDGVHKFYKGKIIYVRIFKHAELSKDMFTKQSILDLDQ